MSFTQQVVEELYTLPVGKSCCQKAYLCGLLFGCRREEDTKYYKTFFYRLEDAQKAAEIIDSRFFVGKKTEITPSAKGGHRGWSLSFSSKALTMVFSDIDTDKKSDADSAIGFRCAECKQQFMRGVFISTAVISRPKSGYHLEFSAVNAQRADMLEKLLADNVCPPGRIVRSQRIGLYYKSNGKIFDLLYYLGASKSGFDVTNISIERDIRNNENRATNCVTRNISRSVGATRKHVEAINYLIKTQKFSLLSEELAYTARLRIEHDSSSLAELALLHDPPISKSGLNGRLAKILAVADDVKNNSDKV